MTHHPRRATRAQNPPQPRPIQLEAHEQRALDCIARGMTLATAAHHLDISDRTLRRRLRRICARLNVATTTQAVVWATKGSVKTTV